MKKILLSLLAFMATVAVNAEQVSKHQALQKAQQFMPGKQFGEARNYARSGGSTAGEPFYVFNAEGNQGFVIVSGDDRTTEILGYSKTGSLDLNRLPENLKGWLDGYARQIEALGTSTQPVQRAKTRGADSWAAIAPIIQTQWNQYYPYNKMCPDKNGYDWGDEGFDTEHLMTDDQVLYHCVTGCVATAMAQVIYYWRCLDDCQVLPMYTTATKSWKMNELQQTTFKWDKMKATYDGKETDESADAVAELMRYCGQAVNMDYNLGASEAALSPYHLAEYFGFRKNAKQVMRYNYSEKDWERMIYKELSAEDGPRPVIYSGRSNSGGHQFIVDGYDGNGLFHMNWGWGGMSDGYYVLSLANSDELGAGGGTSKDGYSLNQNAIIGLMPDDGKDEMPQFHAGFYQNLEQDVFFRGSASEDFTDVSLPGSVCFRFNDPYIPAGTFSCTFKLGWGLYQNGSLLKELGVTESITSWNYWYEYHETPFSFGGGLADGHYQFRLLYKLDGSSDWQLCENQGLVFVDAEILDNKLTLRRSSESEYTSGVIIDEVTFSSTDFEVGKPVEATVKLTNHGDSFQELICFWVGDKRVTLVCGSVESGKTGTVKLHFTPTESGNTTFCITTDGTKTEDNIVWSEEVTVSESKPQNLSATATTPGLRNHVLIGTTLRINANITNEGTNTYENSIILEVYKNMNEIDWSSGTISLSGPLVLTKSVMATILPGEAKEVNFEVKDLDLDGVYFYDIYYVSAGVHEELLIDPAIDTYFSLTEAKEGDVTIDGEVDDDDVAAIVQLIMTGQYDEKADLNGDKNVDAADLVLLLKIINEQKNE